MNKYKVNDKESAEDFLALIKEDKPSYDVKGTKVYIKSGEFADSVVEFDLRFVNVVKEIQKVEQTAETTKPNNIDNLIYGKDKTKGIIAA